MIYKLTPVIYKIAIIEKEETCIQNTAYMSRRVSPSPPDHHHLNLSPTKTPQWLPLLPLPLPSPPTVNDP